MGVGLPLPGSQGQQEGELRLSPATRCQSLKLSPHQHVLCSECLPSTKLMKGDAVGRGRSEGPEGMSAAKTTERVNTASGTHHNHRVCVFIASPSCEVAVQCTGPADAASRPPLYTWSPRVLAEGHLFLIHTQDLHGLLLVVLMEEGNERGKARM